eukprot:4045974-Pyramimonas_sp.AAC.1
MPIPSLVTRLGLADRTCSRYHPPHMLRAGVLPSKPCIPLARSFDNFAGLTDLGPPARTS